tara:strand:- start:261 stop:521 length:261 start_codon:yes stop_codon:yes gene_type:complete
MKEKIQNFILIIASILIGIPLGIVVGLICWFKFPFQIYWQARANLARNRIRQAEEMIQKYENENSSDAMWDRHIERIKSQENNYDN